MPSIPADRSLEDQFSAFVRDVGRHLRLALISAYGSDVGAEATADALAYAWEHWAKVAAMENPAGYLYRVGQTSARRYRRRDPALVDPPAADDPWVEPGLAAALERLSSRQRAAVVLVRGFGYRPQDVADVLGVGPSTIRRHLDRGLHKLRDAMGVSLDD